MGGMEGEGGVCGGGGVGWGGGADEPLFFSAEEGKPICQTDPSPNKAVPYAERERDHPVLRFGPEHFFIIHSLGL